MAGLVPAIHDGSAVLFVDARLIGEPTGPREAWPDDRLRDAVFRTAMAGHDEHCRIPRRHNVTDGSPNGNGAARPLLFEPFAIRGLTLKNRLVVPPMVHYRCEAGHT